MIKWIMRTIYVLLLVGSLSLAAGTLMFSSIAFLVSNTIEAVSGAKTVYSTLKSDLTDKDKKLKTANTKLKKQKVELDGLRNDKTLKSTKINNTKKRIVERAKWRVGRNFSGGLAVQSIPYVGATVIVGLTVLELNDACNTMTDLQNLEKELKLPIEDELSVEKVCKLKEKYLNAAKEFIPDLPDLPDLDLPDWDLPDWETTKEWWDSIIGEPDN